METGEGFPSRWEGWPSALVEAMACGLPAIITDCPGGGKEMIAHGTSGLIVPADDVHALKNVMLVLLKDSGLRAKLAAHANQSVQDYDYKTVTPNYVNFAKSLLKASSRYRDLSSLS